MASKNFEFKDFVERLAENGLQFETISAFQDDVNLARSLSFVKELPL